ncbi:MAG: hypothetical protein RLZ94_2582 [Actinomycetota bacterium]
MVWAGLPLLLAALNELALNVALPSIGDEFSLDVSAVRWTLLAFLIADAAVLILAGRYGDRVGRRRTSVIGLILIAAGSMICLFAPTFTLLLVGRVVEGIGMGVLFSGLLAIITDAVPRESIGRAFGVWAFIGAIALFVSPVVGGFLAEHLSWRWIFGLNAVIAIVALVASRRVILSGPTDGDLRPLQHAALRKIRPYVGGTAVVATVYLTMAMTWIALVFHVRAVHSFGPTATGLLVIAYGIWWLALPPFTGRIADRIGVRRPMLWGTGLSIVGFGLLAFAATAESLILLSIGLSVVGIGVAFTIPAANAAAMGSVPADIRGDASGINMTVRIVGSILGVLVASVLLASASRDDVMLAAPWIWLVAAAAMAFAVIATTVSIRPSAQ